MATTSVSSTTPIMDARKTKLLVRFTPAEHVTTDQYDETVRRLEKSGDWLPEGLEYHVAFKSNGNLLVTRESSSTRSVSASCRC